MIERCTFALVVFIWLSLLCGKADAGDVYRCGKTYQEKAEPGCVKLHLTPNLMQPIPVDLQLTAPFVQGWAAASMPSTSAPASVRPQMIEYTGPMVTTYPCQGGRCIIQGSSKEPYAAPQYQIHYVTKPR